MGIFDTQPPMNLGASNVGMNGYMGNSMGNSMGMGMGMQQNPYAQQQNPYAQQQNPFMQGMGAPQMMPTPEELQIVLLNSIRPIEKWISDPATNSFQTLANMISDIVTHSTLEFFRNAKFIPDENGALTLDVTSLPTEIQSISAENVVSSMQSIQNAAAQAVQQQDMMQQQVVTMQQQGMMSSALDRMSQDPGMMTKAGGVVGGFARSMIGLPPSQQQPRM
jgi:hypothetical protein